MTPVEIKLELTGDNSEQLVEALSSALSRQGIVYVPYIPKQESEETTKHFVSEVELTLKVIVVLGGAGAFTAAYKVICKWLERNKAHEVTIVNGPRRITIRGHSFPDEKTLLAELLTEPHD